MRRVTRRDAFLGLLSAAALLARDPATMMRGRLRRGGEGEPVLKTAAGKTISLDGDRETAAVLRDGRLLDSDLEVMGAFTAPGRFLVGPIHTKAMWVHKDGQRLLISYWCEVCAIRTYSPGKCWCCQEETALDLRESIDP